MTNKDSIKHILFDLGGVLLNIDYSITERAFKDLGLTNFDEIYSQARQDGLFDDFEVGRISGDSFVSILRQKIVPETSPAAIADAWNAMLLDFPEERIGLLKDLSSNYALSLLSNTNDIHYKAFVKLFEEAHKRSFDTLFSSTYYSHQIGMRKPDKDVFLHILNREGIQPEEMLFIDDSIQHVEGAKKLDINTLFLEKGDDIISLLKRSGILT